MNLKNKLYTVNIYRVHKYVRNKNTMRSEKYRTQQLDNIVCVYIAYDHRDYVNVIFSHSFHPSLGGYILKSFAVIAHALRDKLALYGLGCGCCQCVFELLVVAHLSYMASQHIKLSSSLPGIQIACFLSMQVAVLVLQHSFSACALADGSNSLITRTYTYNKYDYKKAYIENAKLQYNTI